MRGRATTGYPDRITVTKLSTCRLRVTDLQRKAQSRIVDMLLDNNNRKQSTTCYWNKTDV